MTSYRHQCKQTVWNLAVWSFTDSLLEPLPLPNMSIYQRNTPAQLLRLAFAFRQALKLVKLTMIQTPGWDKINSLEILFHGLNACNKSQKIKLFRVCKATQWIGLDPWVGPSWLMGHMFDNFVKRLYCGFWKRYYWFCIKLWSASLVFSAGLWSNHFKETSLHT